MRELQDARRRAVRTGVVLDVGAALLVISVGFAGMAAMRRYERGIELRTVELEHFADRVAHDIRGPLTPALLALEIMEGEEDEHLRSAASRGLRSLRTVVELVADLHAFARSAAPPEGGEAAPVREVLDNVLAELRELALANRVVLEVAPFEPCRVACRRGVLASIIGNLVRNAIVHIGNAPERRVSITVHANRDVCLEVADTGPGLSSEALGTVFEPRVRSTGGGLGLGLATVRRLVDAHHGKVGVRSALRAGSTFWVRMPRAP
jgi:signal transduction histidine kinase